MILKKKDLILKLCILTLGIVFCLMATAKENEAQFLNEIEGVKGAVVPHHEKGQETKLNENTAISPSEESNQSITESSITQLAENEIPVLQDKKVATSESQGSLTRILLTAGILAALGLGSYLFIRGYSKPISSSSMQIKVLTQHHLGPRKSLAIIRVAGESILIGITEQNISMIKSLSLLDEDIPEVNENSFSESMKKAGSSTLAKIDDDFSMQGIRDKVSQKLRNMKNLES